MSVLSRSKMEECNLWWAITHTHTHTHTSMFSTDCPFVSLVLVYETSLAIVTHTHTIYTCVGLYSQKRCPKGKHCNFLHVFRNPGGIFSRADRDLPPLSPNSLHSRRSSWYKSSSSISPLFLSLPLSPALPFSHPSLLLPLFLALSLSPSPFFSLSLLPLPPLFFLLPFLSVCVTMMCVLFGRTERRRGSQSRSRSRECQWRYHCLYVVHNTRCSSSSWEVYTCIDVCYNMFLLLPLSSSLSIPVPCPPLPLLLCLSHYHFITTTLTLPLSPVLSFPSHSVSLIISTTLLSHSFSKT